MFTIGPWQPKYTTQLSSLGSQKTGKYFWIYLTAPSWPVPSCLTIQLDTTGRCVERHHIELSETHPLWWVTASNHLDRFVNLYPTGCYPIIDKSGKDVQTFFAIGIASHRRLVASVDCVSPITYSLFARASIVDRKPHNATPLIGVSCKSCGGIRLAEVTMHTPSRPKRCGRGGVGEAR